MSKVTLRKSDVKEFNEKIKVFGVELKKTDKVEIVDETAVLVNNKAEFFYVGDKVVPALKCVLEGKVTLKKIVVDMGAVKFVASGADIMRPGIKSIDETILLHDFVAVVDEKNQKPLAIGQALFNASEMQQMTTGKAIKNLHFVGDKLWNM